MPNELIRVQKLTYEQARIEQRLYWSRKSIPERLAAAQTLTERMYRVRGIKTIEQYSDLTPSRVARSKR